MNFKHFRKFDYDLVEQSRLIKEAFGHLPSVWLEAQMEKLINPVLKALINRTKWRWLAQFTALDFTQSQAVDDQGRPFLITQILKHKEVVAQKFWTPEQSFQIETDQRKAYEEKVAHTPAK